MKKLIMAGLVSTMVATSASSAMAGGPHYDKTTCHAFAGSGIALVSTIIGIPLSVAFWVPYNMGCDHHKEFKEGWIK